MICIYDPETGRVSQCSGDGGPNFEEQLRQSNISFVVIGSTPFDTYVDISTEEPCVRRRPVIEGDFAKTQVSPGEATAHPDIPRGSVTINGPEGSMHIDHLGGELDLEFVLPGSYRVLVDAFPFQYREYAIDVSSVPYTGE